VSSAQTHNPNHASLKTNFHLLNSLTLALTSLAPSFVITSSASTINPGTGDRLAIPPSTLPHDPASQPHLFSTDYGRTKAQAELDTLNFHEPSIGFLTAALRLPGVYGAGDPWMGGPLSRGELTTLPGSADKRVEMVYVKNAAAAHASAILTLLGLTDADPLLAGGRAYHITNGEPRYTMGAFVDEALQRFPSNPKPTQLSYLVSLLVCCFVEAFWAYTCGNVFAPRHPVWNFTRASLSYMSTDQTFSTEGNELIAFPKPLYNVRESLDDMKRELQ
jgi:nucleoside-diphosphate-sugar epimerase